MWAYIWTFFFVNLDRGEISSYTYVTVVLKIFTLVLLLLLKRSYFLQEPPPQAWLCWSCKVHLWYSEVPFVYMFLAVYMNGTWKVQVISKKTSNKIIRMYWHGTLADSDCTMVVTVLFCLIPCFLYHEMVVHVLLRV
jgi:hypothetical protein